MGLTEAQIKAILAEAGGGPTVSWIPTYNLRTGRISYPGVGRKAVRSRNHLSKKRAARKRAKQARKRRRH